MTFNAHKAAESAQQVADTVLSSAQATIGKTRSIADNAIASADDTVRELRCEAGPTLDRLASSAQSLASRSRELAAEARDRAREKAQAYVDATGRHVADKPVQSLLLGVAAGALIGARLASRRRR